MELLANLLHALLYLFQQSNLLFSAMLASLRLRPMHYAFIFPHTTITIQEIEALFDQGLFPNLADLAPAFTYCIIFSVARFFLQNYLIKVNV
jgi:hypothetical protein